MENVAHQGTASTEFESLRKRLLRLDGPSRNAFALVCAERLVRRAPANIVGQLSEALAVGWSVAQGQEGDLASTRAHLEQRADFDSDPVAAAAYALGAVGGSADDAWQTASRSLDSAFDRIEYPVDASTFRPLAIDMATPVVQAELRWQDNALTMLEESGPSADVIKRLRV
jgi:hypothetical protein